MMIYFFEHNMKSRILVFLMFALSSLSQLCGQDRFTLSGRVTDENGDPVELATVHIEKQLIGAMTDFNGKYRISAVSSDSVVVVFSMVGYNTRKRILRYPVGDLTLNVVLPNTGYELGEVTITESRRQTGQTQQLTLDNNRLVPDASGGSIESFIATQAGVSSNNELSSQYNVRGGSYDENIVYVNGVEVYRPLLVRAGQQEGLSFINPDMVESVGFSAGGFEAKYGDKMASVLDITYKKPEAFEGSASLSLLGGSVYAGYGNDKFSFSNGVRYKTNRYLLGSLDVKGEYDPNFIDYQAYITYSPAKNLEFGFIGNFSQNSYNFIPADRTTKFGTMTDMREFKVYFDGQEKDLFRTFFGSLSMKYRINEKNDVSFLFSTFKTREDETFDIRGEYWLNALDDEEEGDMLSSEGQTQGIGTYMEHARNYLNANVQSYTLTGTHRLKHNNTLVWGLELKHEAISERLREWELRDSAGYSLPFVPDEVNLIYNMNSNNSISSNRLSFYLQDTYKFHTQAGMFTLNAGVRGSYWNFNREFILSPRVSLGMIPSFNEDFTFRAATGLYYQAPFYKEFRDTTTVNGNAEITLNRNIKSQRSVHFVLAGDYKFRVLGRPFKFTAEVYYKLLSNLIPYNVDNVRISYYGRNLSHGYAVGLDMKLFGEFVPGTDSWLTLSVMKTQEKLNGRWIPRPTDQRFNLSFYFTDYFTRNDRWKLSLKASLAGGLPLGPPHTGLEEAVFRAPAYKRIDVGMSYRILNNEDGHMRGRAARCFRNIWLGIDLFNLFNMSNVNSYYWVTDVYDQQYAVPNYLTSRQLNARLLFEF